MLCMHNIVRNALVSRMKECRAGAAIIQCLCVCQKRTFCSSMLLRKMLVRNLLILAMLFKSVNEMDYSPGCAVFCTEKTTPTIYTMLWSITCAGKRGPLAPRPPAAPGSSPAAA